MFNAQKTVNIININIYVYVHVLLQ